MFDGKYVKGQIIAKAVQDDYGFFEMTPDHDYSYLVLYKGLDIEDRELHETYFFKVKEINGVPWAHSFIKELPVGILEYEHDPITKIRGHSFDQNDHLDFLHKKTHFDDDSRQSSLELNGNTGYKITILTETGNNSGEEIVYVSPAIENKIEEFGWGVFFITVDDENIVETLDICHYHDGIEKECRPSN